MLSEEDLKELREEQDKRDKERHANAKMPEHPYWQMIWRMLHWKS
jgi:hypothetical protein